MFQITFLVMNTADTRQKLENDVFWAAGVAQKYNCSLEMCIRDSPASKSQGIKQLVAGGGVALIGVTLVPLLSGLLG